MRSWPGSQPAIPTPRRRSSSASNAGCSGWRGTIVTDDRAAEDVAQEAFVRAWKHAAAYDPRRGSVAGWLLTITRNLAIDAVRVRRPVAFDPAALVGLDRASTERAPAELAELGDDTARLRVALGRLPDEQCRAIVLSGLLGYSAREVGEIEDIPLGTAKTRIRTALIRLPRRARVRGAC